MAEKILRISNVNKVNVTVVCFVQFQFYHRFLQLLYKVCSESNYNQAIKNVEIILLQPEKIANFAQLFWPCLHWHGVDQQGTTSNAGIRENNIALGLCCKGE